MAIVQSAFTSSQTDTVLVAAQSDKIILVLRVLATSDVSGNFKLASDPGGASETDLTPDLFMVAGPFDLKLGRGFGLATERGKALGITTFYNGDPANHTYVIWYELVD
ncbi:MAG: hypothetical protein IH986_10000 [Planctomycetes bacterium]|nr:hypothetical protein [Planctomycetota bacterium]